MSNIYIQEPPTSGKVILNTTMGEIEIELWSKEAPKTCRNFIQLCMEGYYNGTVFHRVIRDFIAQGGDPTGTGEGGESIYGEPFKDEFHSRLRFNRRGLIAMANAGVDDNGSQFFFTLGPCPELQKKHTIFGKVGGKTIYNMIKLNEVDLVGERPARAEKIVSSEVIYNPFDDIRPRNLKEDEKGPNEDNEKKNREKKKGVKNFSLLSFGEEAEDDEEEVESVVKVLKLKPKSAHDVGDPNLLSKKVYETIEQPVVGSESESDSESEEEGEDLRSGKVTDENPDMNSIKSKLKKKKLDDESKFKRDVVDNSKRVEESRLSEKELKKKETQDEIKRLQKEILANKKKNSEEESQRLEKVKEVKDEVEVVKKYKEDVEKYEHLKNKKLKSAKEDKTMEMFNSFRNKLFKAKQTEDTEEETSVVKQKANDEQEDTDMLTSFFTHKLEADEEVKQKVIDANVADHERYDIYDPRNPLNKRKREESKAMAKEKKSSHQHSHHHHHSSSSSSSNKYSI